MTAQADSGVIEADFQEALKSAKEQEEHMFHITAPPGLTLASLQKEQSLSSNQSIMRHSARSPKELICIAQAFRVPDAIRGIIPLRTDRLVMHNLTRRFMLNFSLQGELSCELQKIIPPLTKRALYEMNLAQMEEPRLELQKQALSYLQGEHTTINSKFQQSINELQKQAGVKPAELTAEEFQNAIAMRAADLAMETWVKELVDKYDMAKAPELAEYEALPPQTRDTRRIFMINGGVASGKSSAQALEEERAKKEGVDWKHICPINRDAFKPMLLVLCHS